MIRNLNQVTFQGFGNVPPERTQSAKLFEKSEAVSLTLSQKETAIYCAKAETWVTFDSGISVLSVSHDGEHYQHFYLDKPLCIKSGVIFSLTPFQGAASVEIAAFDGLLVDFCRQKGITASVRGIRNTIDYEYETGMALANRKLGGLETVYLPTDPAYAHISSSAVRDILQFGGDTSAFLPAAVIDYLVKKGLS